ncbi:vWA domain-containing protein [Salinibacter ruber]|uniref:vWA domain-containing protein n=1 Tax=Salinibacter ruber TaxID=146919 RepID=UPI0020733DF9|nr:VWA domain-containing protein [Salinibacter ruber]
MNADLHTKLASSGSSAAAFVALCLPVLALPALAFLALVGEKDTMAKEAVAQDAVAQDTVRVSGPNAVRYPTIRVPVSVLRGGEHVQGLSRENFRLFHDGREVSSFEVDQYFDSYAWLAVSLVLDRSGSMKGRPLAESKRAIEEFLRALGRRDRASLITFDEEVRVRASFGASRDEVLARTAEVATGGDTALRDAIVQAAGRLGGIEAPRRAMVVLTDGRDTASGTSSDKVLQALREAGWRCFTVGLGSEINAPFLRQVAEAGDGSFFRAPSPEDLTEVYRRIARELESQYLLTYRLPGTSEGSASRPAETRRHDFKLLVEAGSQELTGQRVFTTGGGQASARAGEEPAPGQSAPGQQEKRSAWGFGAGGWKAAGTLFIGGLLGATVGTGLLLLLGLSAGRRPAIVGSVIGLSGLLGGLVAAALLVV